MHKIRTLVIIINNVVDNSTDMWFNYCTGSWYGRAVCKKRLLAQPPPPGPPLVLVTPFVLNALLMLLGVLAFLCLSLVLLSLCLARRRLSRALVCPPPQSANCEGVQHHVRQKAMMPFQYTSNYTLHNNFNTSQGTELDSRSTQLLRNGQAKANGQAINDARAALTVDLPNVETSLIADMGQNCLGQSDGTSYYQELP